MKDEDSTMVLALNSRMLLSDAKIAYSLMANLENGLGFLYANLSKISE